MTKQTEALRMAIEALEDALTKFSTFNEMQHEAIQACKEALEQPAHDSDCAVHNAPAYPVGECNCSVKESAQEPKSPTILARLPNGTTASNVYEAYEAGLKEGHEITLLLYLDGYLAKPPIGA